MIAILENADDVAIAEFIEDENGSGLFEKLRERYGKDRLH